MSKVTDAAYAAYDYLNEHRKLALALGCLVVGGIVALVLFK
jgi:hypothetical protein